MNIFKKILGLLFLIGGVLLIIVGTLQLLALLTVGPRISIASAFVVGSSLLIFIIPGVLLFWLSRKFRSGAISLRRFFLVIIVLFILVCGGSVIYQLSKPSEEEIQKESAEQPSLYVEKKDNERSITVNLLKCETDEQEDFWSFGGMFVKVKGPQGDKCAFEFEQRSYRETSYSYELYDCQVPKSLKNAKILVKLREISTGPYTVWINDSFPQKKYCEIIDTGFRLLQED